MFQNMVEPARATARRVLWHESQGHGRARPSIEET